MKVGDNWLTPFINYRGTQAEIEALPNIPVGAQAFATDLETIGEKTVSGWKWLVGNPFDYIDFNLAGDSSPETEGRLSYNPDERTLNLGMGAGITGQLCHELFFDVKNQTGDLITNMTPCMFAGTLGSSGRILIQPAIADGSLLPEQTMGLATHDIANGDDGKVTWFGKVRGVDTSGAPYGETWLDGDLLWISQTTYGYLTNVEPSGGQKILVATVVKSHASSGTLLVRPTWDGTNRVLWENNASAGRLWGGIITDAGSGNIDISAGAGLIKTSGTTIDGNLGIPTSINEGQGSETRIVEWDAIEDFPLAGVGYNIIFWDASEGEFAAVLKENFYSTFNLVTDFTVGRVYYDGSTILSRLCGMNRWNFDRRVQMFGEERFPVERAKGLLLSESGTRNIAVTEGVIWAELVNRFSIDAFDSSVTGSFSYWYRNGVGGWTEQATQTQINNTQYDDGDGTLGTLTSNRYGVHWVFVVHDGSVHIVFGQGNYTLTNAQNSTLPASLPGLLSAYASFIGRIIIQKSAATFTEVRSAFTQTIGSSVLTNHNDLAGLQGGTTNEYYHLTAAQATLAAGIPATTAINDFQVGNGSGAWIKKTLAEVVTILRTALDSAYAALNGSISQVFSIADATDVTHAISAGQIEKQSAVAFTTGGTSTAFTLTTSGVMGHPIALTTGERWHVRFNQTAGTSPTLNRDGRGAKALVYQDSSGGLSTCSAATIPGGLQSDVIYDGTYYIVLNPQPPVVTNPPATTAGWDVQVGDGSNNWIKKTWAEFLANFPLAAGTYTPTLTTGTNCSAGTLNADFIYFRILTMVVVAGSVQCDPVAAGNTNLDISIPVASNLANSYDLNGNATSPGQYPGSVIGNSTNDRATFNHTAVDGTNRYWRLLFMYRII